MAKKLTIKTKLGAGPPDAPKERLNLVKDLKTYPRSYRWRKHDLDLINALVQKTRGISNLRVDATKLIRGALWIASKKKPEKLIEAIAEAERLSLISKKK